MTKHIFQSSENSLWYDGNDFNVSKDKAVRYPESVTPIYFKYNHASLRVIQEEVIENDSSTDYVCSSGND
jgi:hypothetical protein